MLAVIWMALAPLSTAAQPVVRVRAETRIELSVERQTQGVVVQGVLRDDLGAPLGGQLVHVVAQASDGNARPTLRPDPIRTSGQGVFILPLALPLGAYQLIASYAGSATHATVAVVQDVDLERALLRLRIVSDGQIDLDAETFRLPVEVSSVEQGRITLTLTDELDRQLAVASTDEETVSFEVSTTALGDVGPGRLRVVFAGDARRAPSRAELRVVKFRDTQLTMERIGTRAPRMGEPVEFELTLTNADGPLRSQAIGIYEISGGTGDGASEDDVTNSATANPSEIHRATVLTDANGRSTASIDWDTEDAVRFVAIFESDTPGHPAARSESIVVAPAEASGSWGVLVSLGALAFALLLAFIVSARATPAVPIKRHAPPRAPAGVSVGKKTLRAIHHDIKGTIIDQTSGEPIHFGAAVWVDANGTETTAEADATGGFSMHITQDGPGRLVVGARGYAPEELAGAIPHRGEWSVCVVRLRAHRDRLLVPFRELAAPTFGQRVFPMTTNQEVAAKLPILAPLSTEVDRLYYGPGIATDLDVDHVQSEVDKIQRDRG